MRPPAAVFLGFGQVDLDNACSQEVDVALVHQESVGSGHERGAPEREFALGTDAVGRKHERAVRDGVPAHHGHPAVLLARVDFLGFGLHPADGGGVDEDVGALEAHDAGGFGEPLVPADKHAERAGRGLDGLEARVAGDKVVLLVKGGVVGDVAFAVQPGDAAVTFKDERAVVVYAAGALLEEREHDDRPDFLGDALPLLYERAILLDGHVEKVGILLEWEIRCVEHLGQHDQVDALALERERLLYVPFVVGLGIAGPLALQRGGLDLVHAIQFRKAQVRGVPFFLDLRRKI